MAVTELRTAERNNMLDELLDAFDAGSGARGYIEIRSGDPGTLLATILMTVKGSGAFDAAGTAGAGIGTAATMTADASADASGTASNARFCDTDGNILFKGTVATSGAEVNLNTTSITAGQEVSLSAGTITMPAS